LDCVIHNPVSTTQDRESRAHAHSRAERQSRKSPISVQGMIARLYVLDGLKTPELISGSGAFILVV
jgi:hypothetical protein